MSFEQRATLEVRLLTAHCSSLKAHSDSGNFLPIWSCSVWGLPCPRHYCRGGALLPHLFTLTSPPWSFLALAFWNRRAKNHNGSGAVCSLWHWPSNGLEPALPDVIRHTALRSSDFPPAASEEAASDRPVRLPTIHYNWGRLNLDLGLWTLGLCLPRCRQIR